MRALTTISNPAAETGADADADADADTDATEAAAPGVLAAITGVGAGLQAVSPMHSASTPHAAVRAVTGLQAQHGLGPAQFLHAVVQAVEAAVDAPRDGLHVVLVGQLVHAAVLPEPA